MTTRPITFSTEMIHALMAGRKHVTRRLVSPQPPEWANTPEIGGGKWCHFNGTHPPNPCGHPKCCCTNLGLPSMWSAECPYGSAGQFLRVREAAWMWCEKVADGLTPKGRPKFRYVPVKAASPMYLADHPERPKFSPIPEDVCSGKTEVWRYKHARYLPFWASRTTLRVESIRVERLGEISAEDAIAEGIEPVGEQGEALWKNYLDRMPDFCHTAVESFKSLWESIHGPDSWQREREKWVWVVGFSKV